MIASHHIDLESLVEIELPPLPDVAMSVAALTQDLDASTRAIAEAIFTLEWLVRNVESILDTKYILHLTYSDC